MNEPVAGDLLGGRYRLLERRAAGATATVWSAHDELLDRVVAVKALHPHLADDDTAGRFAAEARTSATVTHPGLVAVYDTIAGPPPAIVMEWVGGGDLRTRLDTGPLDPATVVALGTDLADALAALHSRGLVHRDVKPANVLLTPAGRPKLGDFGIATANPGDRTATGVVLGTAKYLSPEQVRGERLDGRTDVYSLAAVLYEALTDRPPFERDGDLPTAIARLEETPTPPRVIRPEIPARLEAAVLRGLERDPDNRWRTSHELRDALRAVAAGAAPSPAPVATTDATTAIAAPPGTPTSANPPDPPERRPLRPRNRRWPRVVGFVTLALVALLGWLLLTSGGGSESANGGTPPVVIAANAFDPEGSGAPGEYDELAPNVIDADPTTVWHTERYNERDMGPKSGVGLVLELDGPVDIDEVEVVTQGGQDWAATVHVADEAGPDAASFGPAAASGLELDETARFQLDERGRYVLVWFVDLGSGPSPIRLVVESITVR